MENSRPTYGWCSCIVMDVMWFVCDTIVAKTICCPLLLLRCLLCKMCCVVVFPFLLFSFLRFFFEFISDLTFFFYFLVTISKLKILTFHFGANVSIELKCLCCVFCLCCCHTRFMHKWQRSTLAAWFGVRFQPIDGPWGHLLY